MRKIIQYFPMNDLAYGHILNSAFSLIDNGIDENAKNIFDLISYNNILNFLMIEIPLMMSISKK